MNPEDSKALLVDYIVKEPKFCVRLEPHVRFTKKRLKIRYVDARLGFSAQPIGSDTRGIRWGKSAGPCIRGRAGEDRHDTILQVCHPVPNDGFDTIAGGTRSFRYRSWLRFCTGSRRATVQAQLGLFGQISLI
jgi:hypothetical protein